MSIMIKDKLFRKLGKKLTLKIQNKPKICFKTKTKQKQNNKHSFPFFFFFFFLVIIDDC